jgi:hypothetical protein
MIFGKVKKDAREQLVKLLTFVVDNTRQHGQCYGPLELLLKIDKAEPGFIEVDQKLKDASGNVAVRATQKAIDALYPPAGVVPAVAVAPAAEATPTSKPVVAMLPVGTPIPEAKRGGFKAKEEQYPFATLTELGQGFFVAASEKMPNPAKQLASTVNTANKRYESKQIKFVIRNMEHPETKVKGAGVFRIAWTPKQPKAAAAPVPAAQVPVAEAQAPAVGSVPSFGG